MFMPHCCPYISGDEPPILVMNIENQSVLLAESSSGDPTKVKIKVNTGVTFIATDNNSNVKNRRELTPLGNQNCSL